MVEEESRTTAARAVAGPGAAPADDESGGERVGDAVPASPLGAVAAIGVVGDRVCVDVRNGVAIAVAHWRRRSRGCALAIHDVVGRWGVVGWVHAGPSLLHRCRPHCLHQHITSSVSCALCALYQQLGFRIAGIETLVVEILVQVVDAGPTQSGPT